MWFVASVYKRRISDAENASTLIINNLSVLWYNKLYRSHVSHGENRGIIAEGHKILLYDLR